MLVMALYDAIVCRSCRDGHFKLELNNSSRPKRNKGFKGKDLGETVGATRQNPQRHALTP